MRVGFNQEITDKRKVRLLIDPAQRREYFIKFFLLFFFSFRGGLDRDFMDSGGTTFISARSVVKWSLACYLQVAIQKINQVLGRIINKTAESY